MIARQLGKWLCLLLLIGGAGTATGQNTIKDQQEKAANSGEQEVSSAYGKLKDEGNESSVQKNKWFVVGQTAILSGKSGGESETIKYHSASIRWSGGYQIRHWLQLGVGTGYDSYGYDRVQVFPLFGELRGNVSNTKVSPYYSFKLGTAYAGVRDDWRYQHASGKTFMELQAGLGLKLGDWSWLVGAGYNFQKVKLEGTPGGWDGSGTTYYQERNFRRFLLATSFYLTL